MKWAEMSERERDVLVAEKIMGWQSKPCDLEEAGEELTIYSSGDACCPRCGAYEHINSFEHGSIPPPHYTTSMDAAWQVFQRMAAPFNPKSRYDYEPFIRFVNDLLDTENEELYTSYDYMAGEVANWTPEKICKFALMAIGEVVE